MKMNGRIAGLVLCGFLALFASSAWGEDCTPVVYAFRHAEDSTAFALNPVGRRHAALYPAMISAFQATFSPKLCAVAKVYAVTIADKKNCEKDCKSATNSFFTAQPLATDRMGAGAVPITTVVSVDDPSKQLELYEYVGNGNTPPADPTKPEAPVTRTLSPATPPNLRSNFQNRVTRAPGRHYHVIMWPPQSACYYK